MDRLEAMSVIIAVTETGSFSAASRKLGTPVASVSRKVAELEARLKAELFQRSSRRMTLTDAGRSYIDACKRIIEQVDDAEREVSGEYRAPKGDLAVTAPWGLGHTHLLPIAVEFLAAYPDIALRLALTDRVVDTVTENIDVAIRIGILPDSAMIATRIGSIRLVVCASPAYLAAHGRPTAPDDLGAMTASRLAKVLRRPRGGSHREIARSSRQCGPGLRSTRQKPPFWRPCRAPDWRG